MREEKYVSLRYNPPRLEVKDNAREVVITTVSCMCDNIHYLTFRKNDDGDFRLSGGGFSLSNWQFRYPIHDIEWAADEGNWKKVFDMINSGTSAISEVKSR
jgi:hypothetical protein